MRIFATLTLLVFLATACETENTDQKENTPPTGDVEDTRTSNIEQYKEEFSERELDSLRFELQTPIVDGIYLVQRHGKSPIELLPLEPYEKLLTTLVESRESDAVEDAWTVVNRMHFVPITLKAEPEKSATGEGKEAIYLSLSENEANLFEELTTTYLNRDVAIVIDEQVCTRHTIKAPITNGEIQISSCSPKGCEILLEELKDNVSTP